MKHPFAVWILAFWLLFLAFGGLYGGISMLLDPSGASMQMDEVLDLLPVSDYLLPGLFLLLVMGIVPLALIYGLLARPAWPWLQALFSRTKAHWAWVGTVLLGLGLLFWLAVQGILIGFQWPIQYVTAANGLLILLFAFLPPVRRYYKQSHKRKSHRPASGAKA
jgi:hypothetical protein